MLYFNIKRNTNDYLNNFILLSNLVYLNNGFLLIIKFTENIAELYKQFFY